MKIKMIGLWALICLPWFALSQQSPSEAKALKLALIIANQDYALPELRLDNPINDALSMNESLAALQFETKLILNTDKSSFEHQLGLFIQQTRQRVSLGRELILLVYYAGHGVQHQGTNYLVPIDADLTRQSSVSAKDIEQQFISLSTAANRISTLGAATNIIVLDACRDLPFSELSQGAGDGIGGWADLVKPNFFVAYGTAPGAKALDGTGAVNGLFTEAIVDNIDTPGQNLSQLFQRVRKQVMTASNGYQIPQETNQSTYDFYFVEPQSSMSESLAWALILSALVLLTFLVKMKWVGSAKPEGVAYLIDDISNRRLATLITQPMSLGRCPQSDVVITDTSNRVSRLHCQVSVCKSGTCAYLEEKSPSTNGTFVGWAKSRIPANKKVKLNCGDVFYLAGSNHTDAPAALRVEWIMEG